MVYSVSGNGLMDANLSFVSGMRSGMSNDDTSMLLHYNNGKFINDILDNSN